MTRVEIAASANVGPVEQWFLHTPLSGKPTVPSTASLTAQELAQFNAWLTKRMNGTLDPIAVSNLLPNAIAMTVTYEAYFATPAYIAWAHQDRIWRNAQWRLAHVDAMATADGSSTVPVSHDPSGAGTGVAAAIGRAPVAISPCTSANWSGTGTTATIATGNQTITVPAGNSGNLKLLVYVSGGSGTVQYSKAGGGFITFASGIVVLFANTNTLNFQIISSGHLSTVSGNVIDNDTGQLVGTVSITNTS